MYNNLLNNRIPFSLMTDGEKHQIITFKEAGFNFEDFTSTSIITTHRLVLEKGQWVKVTLDTCIYYMQVSSISNAHIISSITKGLDYRISSMNNAYKIDLIESVEPLTEDEMASVSEIRYRPLTSEEAFTLQCQGVVIRRKDTGSSYLINGIVTSSVCLGNEWHTFESAFDKFEICYPEVRPFGEKV